MSTLRVALIACISFTLFLHACKSSPETVPPQTALEPEVVEEPVVEAPPEEPSFCAAGQQEYTRRAYTWCAVDGVMSGNFLAKSDSGKVVLEGAFKDGLMQGVWTGYAPQTGKLRWRATFERGEEQGDVEGYDEQGTLRHKLGFSQGAKHGVSTYFDANGQKIAELYYESGKPAGEWSYWHANGQMSHAYSHKPDGKTSIHKHWKPSGKKTASPPGQLKKRELLPVLEPLERAIVECYMHARVMDDASGKIVAQLHIGYGGEVSHVGMFADDFQHPFMSACTLREIEALSFPDNPYGPQQLIRTWQLAVQ